MRVHKVCSLLLAVLLFIILAVPVSAVEDDSSWVELLEFASVNDSGSYIFSFTNSGTMNFSLPHEMRLRRVDLLIVTPTNEQPTKVSVTANAQTWDLTVHKISNQLIRVSGFVPNTLYTSIGVKFQKASSTRASYQILSFKVSSISVQEFQASADITIDNVTYATNQHIDFIGATPDLHATVDYQTRINVYDWEKFDQLTIWGSVDGATIDSVRATLGTVGLPMEVNYFQYNDLGSWTEYVFETDPAHDYAVEGGASVNTPFYGKYLFCITIDLASVDRTLTEPIYVYMTGLYDTFYGAIYNCQYVNGSVFVADTSSVSWWNRFTAFMTGILDAESQEAEDFQEDAAQKGEEMDDLNSQLDNVTKPPVSNVVTDLDAIVDPSTASRVTYIFGNLVGEPLIVSMLMITLTIALVSYILFGKR